MAGMVKPVSLRLEDADVRKARPCVYLVRVASATLRSFITGATPTNAAKKMFGSDDVVTDFILRARRHRPRSRLLDGRKSLPASRSMT
jgi:hypothetical protein